MPGIIWGMKKQTVVDGTLASYLELNNQAKQTMVVLHGWGHESASWLGVVERLPKNFRYILIDLPGFGGTQLLPVVADVPEYAEFIQSFLKKMHINHAWFLGHSFGGQIAAYLAIHSPALVERLVLVSPAIVRTKVLKDKIKIFLFRQFGIIQRLFPRRLVEWVLRRVTATDYYNSSPAHRQILKKIVNFEQKDDVTGIESPTLILWGENDSAIAYEGKYLAEIIENARLKVLFGVGHNVHLYKPGLLANEVERYMRI